VDSLAAIDEERGLVYFHGTKDAATESHVYRVALADGGVEKLSQNPGFHRAIFDRRQRKWIDLFESLIAAPTITVRDLDDSKSAIELPVPRDPRIENLRLLPPDLVSLRTRDGVILHGAVYRPPPGVGSAPYPTLVSVYGGPHSQRVKNAWDMTADLRAQFQRSQGYLVFVLDNRGSSRRGLQFEGAIKHAMGTIEVSDQVEGVRWLVEQGLTDPSRVGIYGWSYGGYMAAMALAQAPDVFQAAVAGAPVTSWDGYDTCYTERYMGTPEKNPAGYERGSVMSHLGSMRGSLLLVHGLIDENVHFRHTARLINALVKAGKPYELLLFPDERHTPRAEADRVYMERGVAAFFDEKLRGKSRQQ
jgi:dipeptidyl-peptidase-4